MRRDCAVILFRSMFRNLKSADLTILDWLRHEFGLEKPGQALARPHLLDADGLVAAMRRGCRSRDTSPRPTSPA